MATPAFAVSQRIAGKYVLDRFIGSGTYGTVWAATSVVADQIMHQCALKLMIVDPTGLDSQLAELRQSLQFRHDNIVQCYDCGEFTVGENRYLYLAMELANIDQDGPSLLNRLGRSALSEADVLALAGDLADGLAYLHGRARPCVHRDLKPGNILRVGDRWKIADFGLARVMGVSGDREKSCTFAGTPLYAPPEVYQDVPYTAAWDMWSFGIILVEARTGRRPFEGRTQEALMRAVLRDEPNFQNLTGQLRSIAERALIKEPTARLTVTQALSILRPPPAPSPLPSRRVVPAAILLIAAAGAGALVYRGVVGEGQPTGSPPVSGTKTPDKPLNNSPGTPAPSPGNTPPAPGGEPKPAPKDDSVSHTDPKSGPVATETRAPSVMNPPPIEMPGRPQSGISAAPYSHVDPEPALRAPEFEFTLRAYKDEIRDNTPAFDASDARLTAMSAVIRALGPVPTGATATIRWLRRDSMSPTAREQEVGSTKLIGAAIVGEHECPNKAILPGRYRVELLINGVPQPKVVQFSVNTF